MSAALNDSYPSVRDVVSSPSPANEFGSVDWHSSVDAETASRENVAFRGPIWHHLDAGGQNMFSQYLRMSSIVDCEFQS